MVTPYVPSASGTTTNKWLTGAWGPVHENRWIVYLCGTCTAHGTCACVCTHVSMVLGDVGTSTSAYATSILSAFPILPQQQVRSTSPWYAYLKPSYSHQVSYYRQRLWSWHSKLLEVAVRFLVATVIRKWMMFLCSIVHPSSNKYKKSLGTHHLLVPMGFQTHTRIILLG